MNTLRPSNASPENNNYVEGGGIEHVNMHRRGALKALGALFVGSTMLAKTDFWNAVAAAETTDTHEHGDLEKAWKEGFEKRKGPELLAALKKAAEEGNDSAVAEYINSLEGIEKAIQTAPEVVIRCVEDRLNQCGCGNAGCGVLVMDEKTGKPRVPSEEEMADNILNSPAVKNSKKPIVITEHGECGANRLALAAIRSKPGETVNPASLSQAEVDAFGRERGQKVANIIAQKLSAAGDKRGVRFKEIVIGSPDMPGPKGAHPGEALYVTDFKKGDRVLDTKYPNLPQGMHLNPNVFIAKRDFILHMQTGIRILLGDHGSGHKPVLIVGLTEMDGDPVALRAAMEEAIKDLPEDLKKQVIMGAAKLEKTA